MGFGVFHRPLRGCVRAAIEHEQHLVLVRFDASLMASAGERMR